jgi:PAS domain S-box-containing protein
MLKTIDKRVSNPVIPPSTRSNAQGHRYEHDNLFNNPFIGVFLCYCSQGNLVILNRKALSILGWTWEEAQTANLHHVFRYSEMVIDLFLKEARENLVIENMELEHTVHGKRQWLSISCRYYSENDFLEGFITDITAQKSQEQKLESLREELDLFLYHASHQFKAPLTSILGVAYLLKRDKSNEHAVVEYSDMVENRARHLDKLLKDLKMIHFNNQSEVRAEPVDFYSLLNEICQDITPFYPHVHLEYDFSVDAPFHNDPDRLSIVLRNIVSNAFQFQDPAAKHPIVSITIRTDQHGATLAIRDNGIGIDPEKSQAEIFKVFFRGSEISKIGSGIGLYIVKSITDKLQGTIEVQSRIGSGSTFIIRIPNQIRHTVTES